MNEVKQEAFFGSFAWHLQEAVQKRLKQRRLTELERRRQDRFDVLVRNRPLSPRIREVEAATEEDDRLEKMKQALDYQCNILGTLRTSLVAEKARLSSGTSSSTSSSVFSPLQTAEHTGTQK